MRQAGSIGGGTTEMARNVISERVLGDAARAPLDKDVPFRDVPRSRLEPLVDRSSAASADAETEESSHGTSQRSNGLSLAYEVIGDRASPG